MDNFEEILSCAIITILIVATAFLATTTWLFQKHAANLEEENESLRQHNGGLETINRALNYRIFKLTTKEREFAECEKGNHNES